MLVGGWAVAQKPAPAPATPPDGAQGQPAGVPAAPVPHRGQIVIESHGPPPEPQENSPGSPAVSAPSEREPAPGTVPAVTDAERSAVTIVRYDLDARLQPAQAGLAIRAGLTVRNDGKEPLRELPLQISSTLHWESATLVDGARRLALPLAQHRMQTDTDHTGAATEAVLALPAPLAAGATAKLDLFYSGTVPLNADRLARLGAGPAQRRATDWDEISPEWTGLRGFGDVLWYPVASPQLFLADGNSLFRAVGAMWRREQDAAVHLRLSVDYNGEPPAAAYFCGRRLPFKATADIPDAPLATGAGVAQAEFAEEPLGFRAPSLFVINQPEQMLDVNAPAGMDKGAAPVPSAASSSNPDAGPPALLRRPEPHAPSTDEPVVALASNDPGAAAGLGAAADHASTLLVEWLGPRPLSALTVLDHDGQPFQDGPLLVASAATLETSPELPALVYSLTHAWVQTGQPWMDEGLAQFFALLQMERDHGRDAALAQLALLMQPVALVEPNITAAGVSDPGQPLISATDELFYRRKAAAVWWMLRDIAGDQPLRAALSAWRTQPVSHESAEAQAVAFERLLERLSGKDLGWFFNDWVLEDRGLPNLSITGVESSETQAGPGHPAGWLLAVTVKNDGGAGADVPLVVRSGQFSTTERIHVPGLSQTTKRLVLQAAPTEIVVNDGSTPELESTTHTRKVTVRRQP